MKTEERLRWAGIVASVSAVVFAIPHFWFWFGVSFTYPDDFQNTSEDSVLLMVGGLAVLAAVYAIVLTHSSWIRRLPEFVVALPAWIGSIGFTLWGLAYFGLQVVLVLTGDSSSRQYFASDTNQNAIWGIFWYSLFTIWGLSLGVVAFHYHRLMKTQKLATVERSITEESPKGI